MTLDSTILFSSGLNWLKETLGKGDLGFEKVFSRCFDNISPSSSDKTNRLSSLHNNLLRTVYIFQNKNAQVKHLSCSLGRF